MEQLLGHVRATLAGETPISARAASHLLSLVRDEPETPEPADAAAPHLSPRERELLEYLARGLSRKEAAEHCSRCSRLTGRIRLRGSAKLR